MSGAGAGVQPGIDLIRIAVDNLRLQQAAALEVVARKQREIEFVLSCAGIKVAAPPLTDAELLSSLGAVPRAVMDTALAGISAQLEEIRAHLPLQEVPAPQAAPAPPAARVQKPRRTRVAAGKREAPGGPGSTDSGVQPPPSASVGETPEADAAPESVQVLPAKAPREPVFIPPFALEGLEPAEVERLDASTEPAVVAPPVAEEPVVEEAVAKAPAPPAKPSGSRRQAKDGFPAPPAGAQDLTPGQLIRLAVINMLGSVHDNSYAPLSEICNYVTVRRHYKHLKNSKDKKEHRAVVLEVLEKFDGPWEGDPVKGYRMVRG